MVNRTRVVFVHIFLDHDSFLSTIFESGFDGDRYKFSSSNLVGASKRSKGEKDK